MMRTVEGLFDEMAATLQLPEYFGRNWAALDECLADLEWLDGAGYLLVVVDAVCLLSEEPREDLRTLMAILENVGREWALPIAIGEPWDRPARPFRVLLHAKPEEYRALLDRLDQVGVTPTPLDLRDFACELGPADPEA